jgi:phytoene dehydrogenase-like protein
VSRGVSMKMNLALSGLPCFRGRPAGEGPEHRATIHICPSLEYMDRAWSDCAEGRASEEPMIEMGFPSVYDDSLAPAGKHVASLFVQYLPYGADAEAFGDRVIETIERYAPGFRELVLHRQVLGPRELEERFGIEGGNIFHGDMIEGQLFGKRPGVRTGIAGLYLCGAGTHPGGGVMGVPGLNGAMAVLRDLGIRDLGYKDR